MQYELAVKVISDKPGTDPEAVSSLGQLAKLLSGENAQPDASEGASCDHSAPCAACGKDGMCADCGNCDQCGTCDTCGSVPNASPKSSPSNLGAKAKEYASNGIKQSAIDLFDLGKQNLANEYEDPKTIGTRAK